MCIIYLFNSSLKVKNLGRKIIINYLLKYLNFRFYCIFNGLHIYSIDLFNPTSVTIFMNINACRVKCKKILYFNFTKFVVEQLLSINNFFL